MLKKKWYIILKHDGHYGVYDKYFFKKDAENELALVKAHLVLMQQACLEQDVTAHLIHVDELGELK